MSVKEQIMSLLKMYSDGSYDTKTFCDLFCGLYFFESDGRGYFSGAERDALDGFAAVVERFSDDAEDTAKYPGTYNDEQTIISAFQNIREVFRL